MMTGISSATLKDIKKRLNKLEMLEREISKLPASPGGGMEIEASSPVVEDQSAVKAKIIEALNRPLRADLMVPASGKVDTCRAVFIKSNGDDISAKLTIIEDDAIPREEIQKSAQLGSPIEVANITVGIPEATHPPFRLASPTGSQKSPQGIRRFHTWLSYFYNGRASAPPSPTAASDSAVEGTEDDNSMRDTPSPIPRHPMRGILKATRPLGDLSSLPAPIQKATFLRQEEMQRLARFTDRFRTRRSSLDDFTEERQRSGFARRRKLRFDLERTEFGETYSRGDYERGGVEYIAKSLTPDIAMMIKRELNEVKREMPIHEESKHYTQFYVLR